MVHRVNVTHAEEDQIINTFNNKEVVDNFSVVVNYDNIAAKNYSLSAGQYFEVKIEYVDITILYFLLLISFIYIIYLT